MQLQQRLHKTIVLVTHDINEAIRLGDKIAIFQEGGILVQFDTPDNILAQPASEFVARFIGPEPNLKHLARLQVGQLPRHDVPLVDEALAPISSQHPVVASPLRLVLDKQLRPLCWLDPERPPHHPEGASLPAFRLQRTSGCASRCAGARQRRRSVSGQYFPRATSACAERQCGCPPL